MMDKSVVVVVEVIVKKIEKIIKIRNDVENVNRTTSYLS